MVVNNFFPLKMELRHSVSLTVILHCNKFPSGSESSFVTSLSSSMILPHSPLVHH
jgi:hypothetical protein